jgi:large subunit ribosomal protein L13
MILKRTVRGMLPYKMRRGRDAFSRLKIYVGIPREFRGMELSQPDSAKMRTESNNKYIELGALSKRLGANF